MKIDDQGRIIEQWNMLPASPIDPIRFDASIVKPEGVKREETVNSRPEHEILPEGEINLYDYWKVLVKRKTILIGIVLVPIVIATLISLSLPRQTLYIKKNKLKTGQPYTSKEGKSVFLESDHKYDKERTTVGCRFQPG